ncbi:hypothetical protein [Maribacter luteus]|uniref:hypothetical protein n=1 Tax=Maribacter luteus TaxID=2594478 RepID=UPI0024915459|nr:hypothetical protein [Maribacter luteus]
MKLFKPSFFYLLILLLSLSCEKESSIERVDLDSQDSQKEELLNFDFHNPSDKSLSRIKNWISKKSFENSSSKNPMYFDTQKAVSFESNGVETIVVPEKHNDLGSKENIAITFMDDGSDSGLLKGMIIKTIDISENVKKMEYYNFDDQLLFTTVLDNINQTTKIVRSIEKDKSKSESGKWYTCGDSYGEKTVDCLDDVYTNHGWLSVWASVQSAFIPATAAALAGACAYDALTSGGCETGYMRI